MAHLVELSTSCCCLLLLLPVAGPSFRMQVNTVAACLLCKLIGDWASEGLQPDNTLLLDVCCGTGLFGLTLASM